MESELRQMQMMHTLCDKEVENLIKSLAKFLDDSKEVQDFIIAEVNSGANLQSENLAAVLTYDHFMNQITAIINMTRKLNIHLHLNRLDKIFSNNAAYKVPGIYKYTNMEESLKSVPSNKGQHPESVTGAEQLIDTDGKRSDHSDIKIADSTSVALCKYQSACHALPLATSYQILNNFADIILTTLPKKDFSNFKEGYQFAASITYVEGHKELVFYICEINDFQKLFEFNDPWDMHPITLKEAKQMVFYVSHQKSHIEGQGLIWRGILLPANNAQMDDMILLIDFGERIPVNNYKLHTLPKKYQNIPPLGIRCILEGCETVDGIINRCPHYCASKLLENEFKIAQFRVLRCKCNTLYLILLENWKYEDEDENSENMKSQTNVGCFNISYYDANDVESNDSDSSSQRTRDDSIIITVTHVISLVTFYAIVRDDGQNFNSINPQNKLFWLDNEVSTKQKQLSSPLLNSLVLIQNITNGNWYRGKILEIEKQKQIFKVFYVDYGNTEFVPLSCLAECTELQLKYPEQAVRFRLADIIESYNDVSNPQYPTFIQKLSNRILNQTMAVKVIERNVDEWKVYSTDLPDEPWGDIRKFLLGLQAVRENPIDCEDWNKEEINCSY